MLQRQVFNTLDMESVPDLYMTQFPIANAFAIGTERPIVVLNSELVRLLDEDGRRVVLAHEAAHVHSDHVLYREALAILLLLGQSMRLPILAGLPLLAIQLALLEWSRGGGAVLRPRRGAGHARPAGGLPRADGDVGGRGRRATSTSTPSSRRGWTTPSAARGSSGSRSSCRTCRLTHPMPVRRVRMLLDWVREGDYDRMVRGDYLRRGEEPSAREEAEVASSFYADRVGGAIQAAGSSVAEVGQQLGDWLKRTRSGPDDD